MSKEFRFKSPDLVFRSVVRTDEATLLFIFQWNVRLQDWRADVLDVATADILASNLRVSPGKTFWRFESGAELRWNGPDPYVLEDMGNGNLFINYLDAETQQDIDALRIQFDPTPVEA